MGSGRGWLPQSGPGSRGWDLALCASDGGRVGTGTGATAREEDISDRAQPSECEEGGLRRTPKTWPRSSNPSARTATAAIRSGRSPLRPTSRPGSVLTTSRR